MRWMTWRAASGRPWAPAAMNLDKMELCGRPMNVGRPRGYVEPPPGYVPSAAPINGRVLHCSCSPRHPPHKVYRGYRCSARHTPHFFRLVSYLANVHRAPRH